MYFYILLALGILAFIVDPGHISGGAVPEDQQEAVATVVGFVYLAAAVAVQAIEHAIKRNK